MESRLRLALLGALGLGVLIGLYFAWGFVGSASWHYICPGNPDVDFGSSNGCITTVWPDLTYGEQDGPFGLDLFTVWLLFFGPMIVGLIGVTAAVIARSRSVLYVGLAVTLGLLVLSALTVHLSPGADWTFLDG